MVDLKDNEFLANSALRAAEAQLTENVKPSCGHKKSSCDLIFDPENLVADAKGNVVRVSCADCGYLCDMHPATAYDMIAEPDKELTDVLKK